MVDGLRVCSWLQWKRENAAKQPAAPVSGAGSPPPPAAPAGGDGGGGSDGAAATAADNVEAPAMPEGLSKMEQMKVSISDRPHGWCESSHCPQCRGFNARG